MGMRILNEALRKMVNAEKRGFTKVQLQPMSLLMVNYLNVMKSRGYIKDFEVFEPHRVGRITVELEGRIKDCKALSYRQDIRAKDIESYKSRILPTRQDGMQFNCGNHLCRIYSKEMMKEMDRQD